MQQCSNVAQAMDPFSAVRNSCISHQSYPCSSFWERKKLSLIWTYGGGPTFSSITAQIWAFPPLFVSSSENLKSDIPVTRCLIFFPLTQSNCLEPDTSRCCPSKYPPPLLEVPRLSIRIVNLILPSDTLFGDGLVWLCFDHPNPCCLPGGATSWGTRYNFFGF